MPTTPVTVNHGSFAESDDFNNLSTCITELQAAGVTLTSTAAALDARLTVVEGIDYSGTYAAISHTHTASQVTDLGNAATRNVGTTAGTVAAGDHNHAGVYATAGHNHDGTYAAISHTHAASAITSGTIDAARLGSGSATSDTFLRGDGTWQAVSAGGVGSVTSIDASGGTTGFTFTGGPIVNSGTLTLAVDDAATVLAAIGAAADGHTHDTLTSGGETFGYSLGEWRATKPLRATALTLAGSGTLVSLTESGLTITDSNAGTGAAMAPGESGPVFTGTVTAAGFVGALTGTASGNLTSASTLDATKLSGALPAISGASLTGLTKTQVGLANVDNTADAAKPVSTAQQTALNLKANLTANTFTAAQTIGDAAADATYSAELVTNGDFAGGDTGWTVGAGWSTAGGVATHTGGGGTATLEQAITVSAGTYQVTATVTRTAGSFTITVGGVASPAFTSTVSTAIVATGATGLVITPTSDFAGTIDNVSVKRVTAFPASVLSLKDASGNVRMEFRATGNYNTFAGQGAGRSNTTGDSNTFAGMNAGYSNTTGSSNTFAGVSAGYSNTTGYYNTFAGMNAGYSNTTGYYNTFAGRDAGRSNTTGYSNTYVGNSAGYTGTTSDIHHATAIGYNAQATASNVLILGGSGATDGVKVGIGLTAPTYSLHIAPTGQATAGQTLFVQDATATTGKTGAVLKLGAGNVAGDKILQVQSAAGAVLCHIAGDGTMVSDSAAAGIVLKDAGATPHYWRITVTEAGALTTTDLGTTAP